MNDLKQYRPTVFWDGARKCVKCHVRSKNVAATPEEKVRQTILRFLLADLRWPQSRMELEKTISFVDKSIGRPDIVLTDEGGQPKIVIECKEGALLLGEDVTAWRHQSSEGLRSALSN